ncbi:exonuclease domain-containing protein [Pontixanthobacter aestiaquae]|uniref:3'-5' exonuclease n=1 Tax=Pontixanthobacter aestiaquae TaxID=1509367 RepID=A0A844Z6T8_9SPHN|nr:exonuclease domain-containing protein [Pontixanthobacter aestiaquae]MDN3644640.1 exonuclease domain-containing protein [Pontixanthobacter aestiaquae]MXO84351.1 3'-5' exonuclease [Pontixanthobacter aestiaquae]
MLAQWRFERALKALVRSEHPALQRYVEADWPARDCPVAEAPFLALDFELDGLRKDSHLLQAGYAPFKGRIISLSDAQSVDIQSDADLDPEAVAIHMIGEQRAALGRPITEVAPMLIEALAGRILVAHAATIEQTALQRAVMSVLGVRLPIRVICTLVLERELHPNLVDGEPYRLNSCRARYGLPEYRAHDALTDAIAAAELFQAQLSRLPPDTTLARLEHS